MIENFVAVTNMGYAGLVIWKGLNIEEETLEAREARVEKVLEDARKKVPPVYDSQGKLIEYDNSGRHLNIKG